MAATLQGAAALNSIASSVTHTLDAPSGIVEGELLIAQHRHGQGTMAWTDLGGWTEWVKLGRHTVASKVASAADVALAGTADAWTWTSDVAVPASTTSTSTP
jgi:hypothetical protein